MDIARIGVHESVSAIFPPDVLVTRLRAIDPDVAVVDGDVSGVDAVVSFGHEPSFLDVEWVHCVRAGYDEFPVDAYREAGVALTNSTGIHGEAVGESALGAMLALARRLHAYRDAQNERSWSPPAWDESFTLAGESLAIVGLGTLGRGIAHRADALGMRVTGVRRHPDPVPHVRRVYRPGQLHQAVSDARFVALAVPLTDETTGMVDASVFETMREDAYLVNVARGEVVVESALVEALSTGAIAGAALDAFADEPLPASSPLWGFDDVVVTPHAAAAHRGYVDDVADLVRQNAMHALADEPLANRVA